MRVTQNSNFRILDQSIHRSKARLEQHQTEASTLKRLNAPSDDPVGSVKVLQLRSESLTNEQFVTNAKMAEAYLTNSEQAISELSDIMLRAKELAIGQASGASANAASRLGISEEVDQLYKQAIAIGNRKIGNQYLFSGYKVDHPPLDPQGRYQGDAGEVVTEISREVFLPTNLPGIKLFNTAPEASKDWERLYENREAGEDTKGTTDEPQPGDNQNLFQVLRNLRIALLTNDTGAIQDTLDPIETLHGHLVAQRSRIGARMSGLMNAMNSNERINLTHAELKSNLEDADMAKVMTDMAKEETVFRSALESGKRLVMPTLMDFLR